MRWLRGAREGEGAEGEEGRVRGGAPHARTATPLWRGGGCASCVWTGLAVIAPRAPRAQEASEAKRAQRTGGAVIRKTGTASSVVDNIGCKTIGVARSFTMTNF